jgi:hypothetical protein
LGGGEVTIGLLGKITILPGSLVGVWTPGASVLGVAIGSSSTAPAVREVDESRRLAFIRDVLGLFGGPRRAAASSPVGSSSRSTSPRISSSSRSRRRSRRRKSSVVGVITRPRASKASKSF